jgi:hypothetical protein
MTGNRAGAPLAAILFLVAAALAWAAVGIGYAAGQSLKWGLFGGGLFCAVMGISMLTRARRSGQ